MNAPAEVGIRTIEFALNGNAVTANEGETIIEVADRLGVAIPRLCYKPGMRPDGNCRACMVEIKGERVLAPSCCRAPAAGMDVSSDTARAKSAQRMIVELLAADMPERIYKLDSEFEHWRRELGVGTSRFDARPQPAPDVTHPAMAVNLDACIQCTRCVRACREEQVNDVIGYAFRGAHSKIVFDFDDPMGKSTCVACGECVQACPTGALAPAHDAYLVAADRIVPSVCPYCGVGCQLNYHVKGNAIVRVEGRDGPANHDRLCVKGRFGFDYVQHPQRLTKPLIRKAGVPKTADFVMDPANPASAFREASWDEALDARRRHAAQDPRRARRARARGLRLREGIERGGVSLPEARAHGIRLEQRRPLHAAVPRVERSRASGRHRLGCGVEPGDGRHAGGSRAADRRQSGRQSSGRGDLDQERDQARHEAHPGRAAALGACAARGAISSSSSPTATSRC